MGDTRTGAKTARGGKRPIRRRAVGTRDRIVSHLAAVGAVADVTGMASTRLAEAVGYPGSSVAFAQLLSGMERDGLIVREVRGKRTYRITLPEGPGAAQAVPAQAGTGLADTGLADTGLAGAGLVGVGVAGADLAAAGGPGGFDYDELARRLLVQVLRKLASGSGTRTATVDVPSALAERVAEAGSHVDGHGTDGHGADRHGVDGHRADSHRADGHSADRSGTDGHGADGNRGVDGNRAADLGRAGGVLDGPGADEAAAERIAREKTAALLSTVAGLERELATAWTRHGTLTAENARLREQLSQAQRDLARERNRRAALSGELNRSEVVVLERLLDDNEEPAS